LLYGATEISEFKIKLELFTKMKSRMQAEIKNVSKFNNVCNTDHRQKKWVPYSQDSNISQNRCYNCGARGHNAQVCPDLAKGAKCFMCHTSGHKSPNCPNKETNNDNQDGANGSRQVYLLNNKFNIKFGDNKMYKTVHIAGAKTNALIDTGCDVNLCHTSFLIALKNVKAIKSTIILSGPADVTFETEYKAQVNLEVNGDQYGIELHSIPDSMIMCDVIIGKTLFQTCAELHVKPDEIKISRSEAVRQLKTINVSFGELNVGKRDYYETIQDMIHI